MTSPRPLDQPLGHPRDRSLGHAPDANVRWSLLPGELLVDATPAPRTARDWTVDALLFAGALGMWAAILSITQGYGHLPGWVRAADAPLGVLTCLLLWWRRSHLLGVALAALPAVSLANSTFGAGMVLILNLAMRAPRPQAFVVLALYLASSAPYVLLWAVPHEGGWATAVFVFAYMLVFFAWGSALRARRMLVAKLREDVERRRADHERRLADSRRTEREAIAREMHDVLAHRISLLSVHAGALVYRARQAAAGAGPRLSDAEIRDSADIIRGNAHRALDELREVLHVPRGDARESPDTAIGAPQPTLADIAALVEEARTAGQYVDYRAETAEDVPRPQLQRTAYRVVQEGLTNARKHAPGARLTVRVTGRPGHGLTVELANPLPVGVTASEIPGAGAGLTGLRERVELDGGTLHHGSADGAFTLCARLPWA